MKNILLLITIAGLASTVSAKLQKGEYVEGRLVGKLRAGITVNTRATPQNTGVVVLDSLNRRYRCIKLEPLLPWTKNDDPGSFAADLSDWRGQ